VCLVVELNAFFLLNTLSVPKESSFNSYRLALMFLIGIQGAAEVRSRSLPLIPRSMDR
jgi:phosphatidylserine synthase 1/phosphatidylserine synthase 2